MNQPLISVIVPVYKAEAYLDKCVQSIRNQTYANLEIILVNDGSPDRCGEMCEAFAKEDSRIRVFHKENGGQSSARNLGLDNMTGEYVGFVDSDDWIEPDMYSRLYSLTEEHHGQIACCGVYKDYPNGSVAYFNHLYPGDHQVRVFQTHDALREMLQNFRVTYSPCDKLYHRDIWNGLRMTEGKIYEDMEILPKLVERAQTVVYDPVPKYHYIMTEVSTIRGAYNLRRMAEADIAREKAEDYKVRHPELYDEALGRYIAVCLDIIHKSKGVAECAARRKQMIAEMKGALPESALQTLSKNERLKLSVLRICPAAYDFMMAVYSRI